MKVLKKKKGFTLILIVILVILGVVGYLISSFIIFKQTNSPTNIANETNWKVFKNEERGYQFSYPENIILGSNGMTGTPNDIWLSSSEKAYEYFEVTSVIKGDPGVDPDLIGKTSSSSELIQAIFNKALTNKKRIVKPISKTVFAGKDAYTFKVEDEGLMSIYGESLGIKSIYTYIALENKNSLILICSANDKLLDQILSTFKFAQ